MRGEVADVSAVLFARVGIGCAVVVVAEVVVVVVIAVVFAL